MINYIHQLVSNCLLFGFEIVVHKMSNNILTERRGSQCTVAGVCQRMNGIKLLVGCINLQLYKAPTVFEPKQKTVGVDVLTPVICRWCLLLFNFKLGTETSHVLQVQSYTLFGYSYSLKCHLTL